MDISLCKAEPNPVSSVGTKIQWRRVSNWCHWYVFLGFIRQRL